MDVLWQELSAGWRDGESLVRIAVRLVVAAVLGGLLGLERQYEHKLAGVRTHMLVALGACLFTAAALLGGASIDAATRVIQGIAAGIGFVGGGTILKLTDRMEVRGLTTAANIWLAAAAGVAVGAGRPAPAVLGTALALLILYALGRFEHWCGWTRRP
ncbi:MAG TPA: MgtC/SapB family protein [Gemmataceae bacterium]|nr:MgtC/SapB family protein [Gemmataceae bacterium]